MKQALFWVTGISALFLVVGLPVAFCVGKRVGAGAGAGASVESGPPLNAAVIAALAAAVVLIIGSIGSTTVVIIKSLRETKDVNRAQTAQLANITDMVDGQHGAVLRELADVRRVLADVTGRPRDAVAATGAEKQADTHDAVIEKART